jgi:hypothetical protein
LSINAKPQVIEFFTAHPERWNINGAIKMNSILSRYSETVNSQQPSQDKNQEIHNPANVQPKTQSQNGAAVRWSAWLGVSAYWSGCPPRQYLGVNTPPCSGNH